MSQAAVEVVGGSLWYRTQGMGRRPEQRRYPGTARLALSGDFTVVTGRSSPSSSPPPSPPPSARLSFTSRRSVNCWPATTVCPST